MKISVRRNFTKFTVNTCARVSFLIKLQALGLQLYLKRDSGTKITFFTEQLRETASLFHVEVAEFQPADIVKN